MKGSTTWDISARVKGSNITMDSN